MLIFTWIVLGFAGLLLAASGACWGLFIALDNADWRRLAVKIFRIAMVFVLFYVNASIYAHIFGVFRGTEKPVPAILEDAESS
jgi:Na+-driven multidrug efflux pump